jgi:hypothetical protein
MNNTEKEKSLTNIERLGLNDCEWTFSQEREFMENLFVGRFNTFMIVFSLFFSAGLYTTLESKKYVVFYTGAFVLFLFWLILRRAYKKLDNILKLLHHDSSNHPGAILEKILEEQGYCRCYSVANLMGNFIPLVCIAILLCFGAMLQCNVLK